MVEGTGLVNQLAYAAPQVRILSLAFITRGWHPTSKNIDCLERMVLAYTNKGDIVLDCFSGSGSTCIAAMRTGRQFHGCEIDAGYYEKSLERIQRLT